MYGEEQGPRYEKPASPLGVRIVVVILLVCGLALAALPLTVLLTGGHEPGRLTLRNASGEPLRGLRVIRVVGDQERLVGAAQELADDATTQIEYDADGPLLLRIEFGGGGTQHTVPLGIPDAGAVDSATEVRVGPRFAIHLRRGPATESSVAPPAQGAPEPQTVSGDEVAAAGPYPLPEGWSDKWLPWFEHVDWVVGPEAGGERARTTGKPMMLFYTATW